MNNKRNKRYYHLYENGGDKLTLGQLSALKLSESFNSENLGNSIGAIGGAISGITSAAMSNALIANTSPIEDLINALKNRMVNASSNDELMSVWGSWNKIKDDYSWRDIRGGSKGQRAISTLGAGLSGAGAGATIGGPVGGIIGGVIGLGSAIAGLFSGRRKAKRKARRLNRQAREANDFALASFDNIALTIDTLNDLKLMANFSAFGGPLEFEDGAINFMMDNNDLTNQLLDYLSDLKLNALPSYTNNILAAGGSIYIKPENKGKFTSYCGGKVTNECILRGLNSPNSLTRRRANFARNARGWKHDNGGKLTIDDINNSSLATIIKAVDPTGITSWYDVYSAGKDMYENPSWNNAGSLALETFGALPLVGKIGKGIKGAMKLGTKAYAKKAATEKYGLDIVDNITKDLVDLVSLRSPGIIKDTYDTAKYERNKEKNKKALGGFMSNNFTNGVTTINNGGSHELNPNQGVLLGVDPNGIPNLVEEGEVIYNNYVFSDRLKLPKEFKKKYKLKGDTFAQAAKELLKESEESPNDYISMNSLDSSLNRLAMKLEDMRNLKLNNNIFATGGPYTPYSNYEDIEDSWYTPEYLGFINSLKEKDPRSLRWLLRINNEEFGDIEGNQFTDIADIKRLATDRKKGPVHNAMMKAALQSLAEERIPILAPFKPLDNPISFDSKLDLSLANIPEQEITEDTRKLPTFLRYAPVAGAGIASILDFFNKPDYKNITEIEDIDLVPEEIEYNPISNYLSYNPFDRDFYINKLNQLTSATRRALLNTSGGNRLNALAGILASDYNYQLNLGDLARQAEEYNQLLRERVEAFNRDTNKYNSDAALRTAMFNAESRNATRRAKLGLAITIALMKLAIKDLDSARRSANISNFLQGLGDIGWENTLANWLNRSADSGALRMNTKGKFTGASNKNKNKRKTTKKE